MARRAVAQRLSLLVRTWSGTPTGTEEVFIELGGAQGKSETPATFNLIIRFILHPLVESWTNRNLGFTCDDKTVTHLVWADNLFVLSNSWEN